MNTRFSISIITLLALAIFSLAHHSHAQRTRGPMVTSMSASIDKGVPHPDKKEITASAPITCISAISDDPSSPTPSCKITAPGFTGILKPGEKANATGAGTVTLNCNGKGWVRCHVRIN